MGPSPAPGCDEPTSRCQTGSPQAEYEKAIADAEAEVDEEGDEEAEGEDDLAKDDKDE